MNLKNDGNDSDWKKSGYRYYPLGMSMRREFGCPVWKVSVDAGFSCPNTDGAVGIGGCIFCNNKSFAPSRRLLTRENRAISIQRQIEEGIRQLRRRYKADKFIAYFQPSTNTYDTPARLESVYRSALEHPDIIGLAIGTRPDTLPETVLDLLESISRDHWIQLEIGLQSTHNRSLNFLQRGHDYETFLDAFERSRKHKLRLGVHLILGLPGETQADLWETAEEMARLKPESVKLHNLYVVRKTRLADLWRSGDLHLPDLEDYASLVVDFLERLPPDIVIERISGEADNDWLLAPDWIRIKHSARNAVDQEFRRRNSFQGSRFSHFEQKTVPVPITSEYG